MLVIGIKTKDRVYLHKVGDNSYQSTLENYLINGERPEKTHLNNWVSTKEEPKSIEVIEPQGYTNKRFELRDPKKFPNLPKSYKYEDVYESTYDYEDYYTEEFESVKSLYQLKQDKLPDSRKFLEFEYKLLAEIDILPDFTLDYKYKLNYKEKTTSKEDIQFNELAKLLLPKVLLPTQPCSLTRQRSFDIVREHIKRNIDPKVARVTSDYDFCLEVKKIVPCAEYKVFKYEGKKRQKKVEITKDKKEILCYEIAPKVYQQYSVIEPFKGKDLDDLKKNIDNYLEELIKDINKPLKECPTCNGYGFVEQ